MSGDMPHAAEALMNTSTPTRNTRFLPCASAKPPAGISIAAYTIVYAFRTHDKLAGVAYVNERLIDSKTEYSMVVSRETRKTAPLAIQNMGHAAGSAFSLACGGWGEVELTGSNDL
ncbi:hypothetical protein BCAR13_440060 [Paraburkholderia caribensis]|nr:hypothetical protein BCAR13_440060 [Paraburkholderia caribensis]